MKTQRELTAAMYAWAIDNGCLPNFDDPALWTGDEMSDEDFEYRLEQFKRAVGKGQQTTGCQRELFD